MGNLFNPVDKTEIVQRIQHLQTTAMPEWGTMSVNEMVCHVADPIRDLLGIRKTKPVVPFFFRPVVKTILLSKKPKRQNSPTIRPFRQGASGGGTKPTSFESDKLALLNLIETFSSIDQSFRLQPNPGAGKLNREEAGFVVWSHLDHHLKQFGG